MSVRIAYDGEDCAAFAELGLVGGGIRQYVCCDRAVIPLDTVEGRRDWYSGTTLAPWPNRLAGGAWTAEGVQYEGECNDPRGHALHGLVYNAEFHVASQMPSSVTLAYELGDHPIYPFAVRIEVSYAITRCALTSTVTATNRCDERVPIALGVHPYFPFADDTAITTSATHYFKSGANLIPTGDLLPVSDIGITPNAATALGALSLDNCLTDLDRDSDGRAHTLLTYADGTTTDIWQDAGLAYTQVFTKHDFPWAAGSAGAVGIEPQSAPANALNSGVSLTWLEPGSSFSVTWGVRV